MRLDLKIKAFMGICLLFWTVFVLKSLCQAQPPIAGQWTLTFDDEFTESQLDTTKWNTTYPYGRRTTTGNQELEWYVDNSPTLIPGASHTGILQLIAKKQTVGNYNYTSGMISSQGKFAQQYGYFEMRALLPKGQGLWPAFWLLPNSNAWPPEIDIMENLGNQVSTIFMTNHYVSQAQMFSSQGTYSGPDFSGGLHVFAIDWEPNQMSWYVDNVKRYTVSTGIPNVPMYILANLAVGGTWPGAPNASTQFPAIMSIDYIHVYQKQ
jgi:beta-glucanase (GH16 family)